MCWTKYMTPKYRIKVSALDKIRTNKGNPLTSLGVWTITKYINMFVLIYINIVNLYTLFTRSIKRIL